MDEEWDPPSTSHMRSAVCSLPLQETWEGACDSGRGPEKSREWLENLAVRDFWVRKSGYKKEGVPGEFKGGDQQSIKSQNVKATPRGGG